MDYSIGISHITAISCMVYIDNDGAAGGPQNLTVYESDGTTVVKSISVSDPGWVMSEITVSGLTPNTTYVMKLDDYPTVTATFTTLADEPKVATESMWADLVAKVKAKADSSSIPTVNDSTITVTNNGASKGTFTTNQASAGSVALDYPVITMTTTDPGEGSALAENNYIGVYGGDPIIMDYSTSEVNTGMKWIDGSAIYKKTINVGAVTAGSSTSVNHNISSLGIFIKSEAWGSSGNVQDGYFWYSIPCVSPSGGISLTITETEIGILSSSSNLDQSYVTLYYTKSS